MDHTRFDPVVTAITHRQLAGREHHVSGGSTPAVGTLAFYSPAVTQSAGPARSGREDSEVGALHGAFGGVDSAAEPSSVLREGGDSGAGTLDTQPSEALMEGPAAMDVEGGAEILPPFEQQLAQEGVEF